MASELGFMSPGIRPSVKLQKPSAGAGAPASAAEEAGASSAAGTANKIQDFAISNPLADNLIEVPMDTLSLPK